MRLRSLATSALLAIGVAAGCDSAEPTAPRAPVLTSVPADRSYPPGQWLRWGGPQGTMTSPEVGWNARWSEKPPAIVWQASVGTGFSSVTIADGRLFTMGYGDDRDHVYGLDATTGQQLWEYSYPCAKVDNLHEGGPGATPTIDEGRVYTLSREGHLFCFDAQSGMVLWSKQLEEELGVEHPEWGFTCSPLVAGNLVIVDVGPTVALDKQSGQVVWKTKRYRPGYGSPALFTHAGQLLVAVLNNDGLLVLRPDDGSEVAFYAWETNYATNSTTPIADGDTLFISTGYGKGCALVRLADGRLEEVYRNRNMRNHMNNCALWDGHLYGIDGQANSSGSCRLVCLKHETGEVAWSHRGLGCGSLLAADGKLIVLTDEGTLVLVEATPESYRELGRVRVLTGRCWTVPVLAGHRVYCRNAAGDLVCVDLSP